MITSASEWSERGDAYAELCIVGAGAAGLEMARFFNGSELSVVVVEGGGLEFDADTQRLHEIVSVGKEIRSRSFAFNPHLPPAYQSESRIRQFGGTTNIWSGKWKPHAPDDFQGKSWILHSGWPISYSEVLPYYLEVSRDYAIPELLFDRDVFGRAGDRQAGDALRYTLHYQQSSPLNFNKAFRGEFERSENVTVILHANAVGLFADDQTDSIGYVVAKNLRGHAVRVHAKVFVLAAGGLENARLLLNSRGRTGVALGNHHDLVGRFYMDHPKGLWGRLAPAHGHRLRDRLAFEHQNGTIHLGFAFAEDFRRKHHLPNHSTYLNPQPIGESLDTASDCVGRTWRERDYTRLLTRVSRLLFNRVVRRFGWLLFRYFGVVSHYELIHYLEQVPNPDSRLYLSATLKDQLNEPVLVVAWRLAEFDLASFERYLRLLRDVLKERHIGDVYYPEERVDLRFTADAAHHMGTTRMAASSTQGVVDENCKVFGIDNLYVIGSSVFSTAGNANPTFTILALTRRLCHHLERVGLPTAAARLISGDDGSA